MEHHPHHQRTRTSSPPASRARLGGDQAAAAAAARRRTMLVSCTRVCDESSQFLATNDDPVEMNGVSGPDEDVRRQFFVETRRRGKVKRQKADAKCHQPIATVTTKYSELSQSNSGVGGSGEFEKWYKASGRGAGRPKRTHSQTTSTETALLKSRATKNTDHHPNNNNTNDAGVQIRIKIRQRSVLVLPLFAYARLQHHLTNFEPPSAVHVCKDSASTGCDDVTILLSSLDPWLSVKSKAELAGSVVALQQALNQATDFLVVLVLREVAKQADTNMVLRGNSIATKATEVYLRLVGESYLSYLLADFAAAVLTEHAGKSTPPPASASKRSGSAHKRSNARSSTADCYEVDPAKLTSSTELLENQQNLLGLVETVWTRIVTSESHFPPPLRVIFALARHYLESSTPSPQPTNDSDQATLSEHVISACLFLRYICPAILSPSLFGLVPEFPSDLRVLRTFTLVAKVIQSLANFTLFSGSKEFYMTFVNQFVAKQLPTMRQFLHSISTPAYPSNGLALSRPIAERLSVSSSMENGFPSPTGDNMLSRVSGSQSHHAGFQAPPMLATTTPINPASVGANSIHCPDSSSSQFLLTRSVSGLPTYPAHYPTTAIPKGWSSSDIASVIDGHRRAPSVPVVALPEVPHGIPELDVDLAMCLALCHLQLSEAIQKIPLDQIPPQVSAIRPILQELDFFIASGMDPSPDWFRPVSTPEAGVVGGVPQSRSNGSLKRFPPQQLPPSKCQSPMTSLYTSMIQSSKPEPTPRTAPLSTRPARQISSASERLEVTMQPEIKGLPAALEFQSHLSSGIIQEQYAILEDQSQSFDLSRAGSNALLRDRESSEPVPAYAPNPPMELTTVTTNVPPPVYTPPTPYGMVHTHQSPAPNSDRTETATAATMVVYLPPEHRDPRCLKQALSDDSTLWSLEETDSTAGGALSSPSDPDVLQQFGGAVATGNQPTGLANSNSSGYQSLGRQSVSDRCRPPVATVEERRRPRRPLSSLNGDTPPVQSPSSGSCTPNEAVVEPIQAFPSAPTSRHTYVNLSDEALARIAVPPPASNSHRTPPDTAVAGLPHSWNETADGDDCCNAFTPPPPAESPSPRSSRCVPRLDSMGFVAGGVGGRQQHRPRLDGIHSVRSKLPSSHTEASRRPRLFRDDLSPPPTDGYTLQTEIDASQARLAEARSRLLANEAERIQLIRVWHEELMKQSQLVNTASVELWGATAEETEPPPPPPQRGRNHGGSLSAARGAVTRSPSSPGLSNTAAGANNDQHQ